MIFILGAAKNVWIKTLGQTDLRYSLICITLSETGGNHHHHHNDNVVQGSQERYCSWFWFQTRDFTQKAEDWAEIYPIAVSPF